MPQDLEELSHVRRQLRAQITDPTAQSKLPALDADCIEEFVLALDELMSNGLRHGRPPVEVQVCAAGGGVLILVSDRATENPPQPTSTRDAAQGGMAWEWSPPSPPTAAGPPTRIARRCGP